MLRSCEIAGIHHTTLSDWKQKDPKFAAEIEYANRQYIEKLAVECDRRAIERRTKNGITATTC